MTPRPPRPVRTPAPLELVIDSSDAGHVVATFNPILIAVFTRVPAQEELDLIERRAGEAGAAGIAGGLLYVVARKDMGGGVDPRVRAVFERKIRENQGKSGSSAVVVLTEGFAAAVVRGALTSLLLLFRRRGHLQVFSSIEEACRWLAAQHGIEVAPLLSAYRRATANLADLPG